MTDQKNIKDYTDEELLINSETDSQSPPLISAERGRLRSLEMTRRLKNSVVDLNRGINKLDRTTTFFNKVLLGLTVVLIFIGLVQTILALFSSNLAWVIKVSTFVIFFIFVFFLIKKVNNFIKE